MAQQLAASLGREAILYDTWYEAELARPDLDTYLQALYHDQAELIAVFLCADYERKEWCGLEWRAVRDLIKRRRLDSVMPLRWDERPDPSTESALRLLEIAALAGLADPGSSTVLPGRLADLRALVAAQPADFKVGWSFAGTTHYIETARVQG